MRPEERFWFPEYREGKKLTIDRQSGFLIANTHRKAKNHGLVAPIPGLLVLMLIKRGFAHKSIAEILGCTKSVVSDEMYEMRAFNHKKKKNQELFRKAKALGLDNLLSIRGLALEMGDRRKRDKLLRQIDNAAIALNQDLLKKREQTTFTILPDERSRELWYEWFDTLRAAGLGQKKAPVFTYI